MKSTLRTALIALSAATLLAGTANAEMTISAGIGANASPHSNVDYDFNNGTSGDVGVGWDGASFEMPPVYNVRGTYWLNNYGLDHLGIGLTYTHAKVKADLGDASMADFSTLEFTDGINFLTANLYYRYDMGGKFTPYAGIGAGLAIPHVEVDGPSLAQKTFEYQVTGVAAEVTAGIDYELTEKLSAFAEYKFNYGQVDADLVGGGSLSTDIISNQVFIGLTYKIF